MKSGKYPFRKIFSLTRWLSIVTLLFSSFSWSMTNSDYALLGLMIDSYKIKIEAWSSIDVYSEDGPNIDVYPVVLSMEQRLFNVDDQEEKLFNAQNTVKDKAKAFALDWQQQGLPSWDYGSELEASVADLGEMIKRKISADGESMIRVQQLDLLLRITSIYVFKGNEVSVTHDISSNENVEQMVSELDKLLKEAPVTDNVFSAKWRFIKPVILKMDFRAPSLVKRHALSMAVILERSLDG